MGKAAGQRSTNAFRRVVFPFVEHGIKLNALAHVLTSANPLVQELYIGTVENLQPQEAVEVNQHGAQTKFKRPVRQQTDEQRRNPVDPGLPLEPFALADV
jgi:hypothetical protein